MVEVEEQDALGLRQLSPKLISTCIITKYGKLHYSMLIRVVESCTMALIQQNLLQTSIRGIPISPDHSPPSTNMLQYLLVIFLFCFFSPCTPFSTSCVE